MEPNSTKAQEWYESGVYMIRSLKADVAYVGRSCFLSARLKRHAACIFGKSGSDYQLRKAFAGHRRDEVEFRILEFIEMPKDPENGFTNDRLGPGPAGDAYDLLRIREHYWIATLNPSVNVKCKRVSTLHSLPVGPPPTMKLVKESA